MDLGQNDHNSEVSFNFFCTDRSNTFNMKYFKLSTLRSPLQPMFSKSLNPSSLFEGVPDEILEKKKIN